MGAKEPGSEESFGGDGHICPPARDDGLMSLHVCQNLTCTPYICTVCQLYTYSRLYVVSQLYLNKSAFKKYGLNQWLIILHNTNWALIHSFKIVLC